MNEPDQVGELRNPSLTLYAFHLRNDLSQGPQKAVPGADRIWDRLSALGETLKLPALQALKQNLTCYENGKYSETVEDSRRSRRLTLLRDGEDCFDFQPVSQPGNLSLQGFLCPFRLHDTYAVDLTLFYEDTIRTEQLSQLNPQGCLLPQQIQASLGQTLLLFAEPVNQQDDYQGLANDCVAELLSGFESPEFEAKGRLLGDPIFEYDNGEIDPVQRFRIILWLKCQAIAPEQLDKVNQRLFYLLYSQHLSSRLCRNSMESGSCLQKCSQVSYSLRCICCCY